MLAQGFEVDAVGRVLNDELVEVYLGRCRPGQRNAAVICIADLEQCQLYGQRGIGAGYPLPEGIVGCNKRGFIGVVRCFGRALPVFTLVLPFTQRPQGFVALLFVIESPPPLRSIFPSTINLSAVGHLEFSAATGIACYVAPHCHAAVSGYRYIAAALHIEVLANDQVSVFGRRAGAAPLPTFR